MPSPIHTPNLLLDRGLLVGLLFFSWYSVGFTIFNGVDTPLFVMAAVYCLWHMSREPLVVPDRLLKAWAFWAFWVVVADFFSTFLTWSLARDAHWLVWPILVVVCARHFTRDPRCVQVLRYTASGSIMLIVGLLIVRAPTVTNWVFDPVFGHIRHLAMAVGVLFVWLLDDDGLPAAGKWWLRAGRLCGFTVLLWSGGRGALIATAMVLVLTLWLRLPVRRRWKGLVLEVVIALVVAFHLDVGTPFLGFIDGFARTFGPSNLDQVSTSRLTQWTMTWNRLSQGHEFWLGAGGNGYIRMGLAFETIFHPHNVILQMMTDWGVVGLGLAIYLIWWMAKPLGYIALGRPAAALGLGVAVFLGFMGFVDGGLYHPQFLVCLAIATGAWLADGGPRVGNELARPLAFSPVILLIFLLGVHLKSIPLI